MVPRRTLSTGPIFAELSWAVVIWNVQCHLGCLREYCDVCTNDTTVVGGKFDYAKHVRLYYHTLFQNLNPKTRRLDRRIEWSLTLASSIILDKECRVKFQTRLGEKL